MENTFDPDESLRRIRIIVKLIKDNPGRRSVELASDAITFASEFNKLDKWLTNKNFVPKDWTLDECGLGK